MSGMGRMVQAGLASLLIVATAGGWSPVAGQSLNVLLTNDDGFDAPGIVAVRHALLKAGHRVTMIAPLENQSGVGSAITTSGTIDYYPQEDGVWAVDGTPSDAVSLALVHVMGTDRPDVVISGANFGQNVGANVVSSGTVAAALDAVQLDLGDGLGFREVLGTENWQRTWNVPVFTEDTEQVLRARAWAGDLMITDAVTVGEGPFRFAEDFQGLEVIPKAGTVIAHDGERPIRTPYGDFLRLSLA